MPPPRRRCEGRGMRLKDKVALVTGGGSGIGRATVLRFAGEGAKVAVVDKATDRAETVAGEVRALGADALAITADVSRGAETARMVAETVARFGRLDVLVNNAGYGIAKTVVETTEDEWD